MDTKETKEICIKVCQEIANTLDKDYWDYERLCALIYPLYILFNYGQHSKKNFLELLLTYRVDPEFWNIVLDNTKHNWDFKTEIQTLINNILSKLHILEFEDFTKVYTDLQTILEISNTQLIKLLSAQILYDNIESFAKDTDTHIAKTIQDLIKINKKYEL